MLSSPGLAEHLASWLTLPLLSPLCEAHSTGLQPPPFPSRTHHLILIKHAELLLLKSPQRGLT
jgi:hypothetical protein